MIPDDLKPTLEEDKENPPIDPPKISSGEVIETIKQILESPAFINRILTAKQVKRPPGVSKLSTFSYYRPQFGLQAKVIFDQMIEDKRDREWKYSDYPDLRPSSLYQRVYQSLNFLVKELDPASDEFPDGKYTHYKMMMVLSKEKTGVRLSWIRDRLEGKAFSPSIVEDRDKLTVWKDEVESFIDDRRKQTLHLKRLSLTTEQIDTLRQSFEGLEGIHALITEKEIKLVKDNFLVDKDEPV